VAINPAVFEPGQQVFTINLYNMEQAGL